MVLYLRDFATHIFDIVLLALHRTLKLLELAAHLRLFLLKDCLYGSFRFPLLKEGSNGAEPGQREQSAFVDHHCQLSIL